VSTVRPCTCEKQIEAYLYFLYESLERAIVVCLRCVFSAICDFERLLPLCIFLRFRLLCLFACIDGWCLSLVLALEPYLLQRYITLSPGCPSTLTLTSNLLSRSFRACSRARAIAWRSRFARRFASFKRCRRPRPIAVPVSTSKSASATSSSSSAFSSSCYTVLRAFEGQSQPTPRTPCSTPSSRHPHR
jgi:hypothetical protein